MYHHDTQMIIKGPTGWTPLQETISYVNLLIYNLLETY